MKVKAHTTPSITEQTQPIPLPLLLTARRSHVLSCRYLQLAAQLPTSRLAAERKQKISSHHVACAVRRRHLCPLACWCLLCVGVGCRLCPLRSAPRSRPVVPGLCWLGLFSSHALAFSNTRLAKPKPVLTLYPLCSLSTSFAGASPHHSLSHCPLAPWLRPHTPTPLGCPGHFHQRSNARQAIN